VNSLEYLHPDMKRAVREILQAAAPRGTVTSTFRSVAEQARLRKAYESGHGYPAERPGVSTHHTGLSVDFVVPQGANSPEQRALGEYWKSLGGHWPGPRDPVHFQHPEAGAALAAGLVRPRWWL